MTILPGQVIGLCGPSGSGKSSILRLVERFYDPTSGNITLDNCDLTQLNVQWLRQQIGLVGQEPVLFQGSLRENMAICQPSASLQDIIAAAKLAQAHDFIMNQPEGYETQLGELKTLSGGQQQRIAISRALLKKPKILLLDEATSALDSESEVYVQRALDHLIVNTHLTVLIIAHRLSTIRYADQIFYIGQGRVQEQGTHSDLMQRQGKYCALVKSQS